MKFLEQLDAEILKVELLAFLNAEEIDVENIEDFEEQFVDFIKTDLSYGDGQE